MIGKLLGLVLFGLAAAGSPALAKAPAKTAHRADWTRTFAATPAGGFKMGNPNARIAVVEYGSLVCPHCRHFAETGATPLIEQYVRTGKASYEFRPFILNGVDIAATLVASCGGPSAFFPIARDLYATQSRWLTGINDEQREQIAALPDDQIYSAFAKAAGILPVASAHGVSQARAEKCLRDQSAALRLAQIAQRAAALGVTGTPTFFVNGQRTTAYDWPTLKPLLVPART